MIHKASKIIVFTPVVSTGAYSAGDQVGGLTLLSEAVNHDGGYAVIQSITVIDKAKQKAALSLFFFDDVPTITSVDNGAFDLTDAQAVLSCLGHALVPSANYQDSSSNSIATTLNVGLLLRSRAGKNAVPFATGATPRDIWCVIMTTGTPTYGAASDLCIKLGFEQH
jgi:hypothetical protein